MMKFIEAFEDRLGFCSDAKECFKAAAEKIILNPQLHELFLKCEKNYFEDDDTAYTEKILNDISNTTGIHIYTVSFVFLMFCAKRLKENYLKNGLSEELFWDLMRDLKCKLDECYTVYKIWGTFVFGWFNRHYKMTRFALGRFQYEKIIYNGKEYQKGGIVLRPGDEVYNFHIPSMGSIDKEKRLDSYKKAFKFFAKPGDKYIIFVCMSYLLYPDNKNIFPKNSNLYSFMEDFDIIDYGSAETFSDAWRIFGCTDVSDLSALPQNTELQRNYVKWLQSGKKTGGGTGVIIFDGEKII